MPTVHRLRSGSSSTPAPRRRSSSPEILDELGYSPRQGEAITTMRSAVGREEGYMIRVARFACLGHHATTFLVHVNDLPEGWGIDGLIGLSFLRQFNYEIRSLEGRILVDRAVG